MKKILSFVLVITTISILATPINDECADAVPLTLQNFDTVSYTIGQVGNATESTPACSGTTSTDIWYSFTANSYGNYINMPSQSGLDVAFELFDSCGGTSIACVDNNSTNFSESYYKNNFVPGHTYFIKVFLYNQSFSDAEIEIAVVESPIPINNECDNAIPLVLQNIDAVTYTTNPIGGATESTSACSGTVSTDIWYSFTANSVGNYISLNPEAGLDLAFEILDACDGASIACVDYNSTNYSESYYSTDFTIGHTYLLKVFLYNQSVMNSEISIAVIDIPTPENDNCTDAFELSLQSPDTISFTTGELGGATESMPACSGGGMGDVWYSFTAVSTSAQIDINAQSSLDSVFEVFDSCDGTSLFCVNANGINYSESYEYTDYIPGDTYYIRVHGYSQKFYNMDFEIAVINTGAIGVNELNPDATFSIFPNPAKNKLVLNNFKGITGNIYISTLAGVLVLDEKLQNKITIDISNLHTGIYLLSIQSDKNDTIYSRKFIKEL